MTTTAPTTSPSRVRSTKVAAAESDTRDCIVRAALALFAKHGIDGVSLRQIVTAAGQSNPSAVHYHFQNKDGLVTAVFEHVAALLTPLQDQALVSMTEAQQQGRLTVHEVVRLTAMPMILTYTSGRDGRQAIRFLSRLTWQPHHSGNGMLLAHAWSHISEIKVMLSPLVPHRSDDALHFLVVMFVSNLIHGLADISLLGRHPSLGMTRLYSERAFELMDWYVDYVAVGLVGTVPQAMHEPVARSIAA